MNVVDGRVEQEELARYYSCREHRECRFISDLTLISHIQPTAAGTLRPLAVIKMLGRQASRIGGRRPSGTSTPAPVLTCKGGFVSDFVCRCAVCRALTSASSRRSPRWRCRGACCQPSGWGEIRLHRRGRRSSRLRSCKQAILGREQESLAARGTAAMRSSPSGIP